MDFNDYVRNPFLVKAVEVTTENMEELARTLHIGEVKTNPKDGTPYIAVDRRVVPNVYKVYPGYFVTVLDDKIRCYNRRLFFEQFSVATEEIVNWVREVINPEA